MSKLKIVKYIASKAFMALAVIVCLFSISTQAYSLPADTVKPFVIKPGFTPLQKLRGDTLVAIDSSKMTAKPGAEEERFTPEQDSAFVRAMRLRVSGNTRFVMELRESIRSGAARRLTELEQTALAIRNNMAIDPSVLLPSRQEMNLYRYNLDQSQRVMGVNTTPLAPWSLSLNSIGQFLGLVEDTSPEIKYEVDFTTDVVVVIYSVQATVIRDLFKGPQSPNKYTISWNKRDNNGRLMPAGDYVAEVRIGKIRTVRKHIYID